jgi:hypothetical protein
MRSWHHEILSKKKWNVWNYHNRLKVEQDEKEFKELKAKHEATERQQNSLLRIEHLRAAANTRDAHIIQALAPPFTARERLPNGTIGTPVASLASHGNDDSESESEHVSSICSSSASNFTGFLNSSNPKTDVKQSSDGPLASFSVGGVLLPPPLEGFYLYQHKIFVSIFVKESTQVKDASSWGPLTKARLASPSTRRSLG